MNGPAGPIVVGPISTSDTYELRRRILRAGTPSTNVTYPQDDLAGTEHLGAFEQQVLIGVSTWAPETYVGAPNEQAVRLRGMAVEADRQGTGLGQLLVEAGIERYTPTATLIWAHARDPVLGFYQRLGFDVVGDGFVDDATAIPHHLVVRRLG